MMKNRIFKLFSISIALIMALTGCNNEPEQIIFDGPHFVSFSTTFSAVVESGSLTVPLIISKSFDRAVTIQTEVADQVNVTEGVDYTLDNGGLVTIEAGKFTGNITIRGVDDDELTLLSREFKIKLVGTSEADLSLGAENVLSIVINDDDCFVNTSLWAGQPTVEDVGFGFPAVGSATPGGGNECNVLYFEGTDFANAGPPNGPCDIQITLLPSEEGATSGTVLVPKQLIYGRTDECTSGYTSEYEFEGFDGTYDELADPPFIRFDYVLTNKTEGGDFVYDGTNVITP